MDIDRTLRLSTDQYYRDVVQKHQIVLHHTVGGSAKSTFEYWEGDQQCVGTAYIIERDGTVYEVFDPHYWAHHLGLRTANNRAVNQKSIGIELASEGALRTGLELNAVRTKYGCATPFDPQGLYAFDIDLDVSRPPAKWFTGARKLYSLDNAGDAGKYHDCQTVYRGFRYFDAYDGPQVAACVELVGELCADFGIPQAIPEGDLFAFRPELVDFEGVVHHAQVRADKSDLHPGFQFSVFKFSPPEKS